MKPVQKVAGDTTVLRHDWQIEEVMSLLQAPFNDLMYRAGSVHREYFDPNAVQISTLLSVKTGACPENCKYCPQSAHYNTRLKKEPLMPIEQVKAAATKAKDAGASRFCMGAAWRHLHDRDVPQVVEMVEEVKALGLETCMTLGMATKEQLHTLKEAGLDYYNHNIDTSEYYYDTIITTRTFQDRLDTLQNIQESGLNTCSGGIVGMGESLEDRAAMLQTLANLPKQPRSVPINMLVKVEGTPLDTVDDLEPLEFVRVIAVARVMMPQSYVRLSAGREQMSDSTQALCFLAGANSIFYGDTLLTTDNPAKAKDDALFAKLGLHASEDHLQKPSQSIKAV